MEGFTVGPTFLCKELAWIDLDTMEVNSEYFKVNIYPKNIISNNDWRTIRFCQKFVHGLAFKDSAKDKPQWEIDSILLRLAQNGTIGYKGGLLERNRLQSLGINGINIENFGCPKFNWLYQSIQSADRVAEIDAYGCSRHRQIPNITIHCPRKEVYLFAVWLKGIAIVG